MSDPEAFPLAWPAGYERAGQRENSAFKMSADKSQKHLLKEIEALSGDKSPLISSNVPLRKKDNQMYAEVANDQLADPGVAVYFMQDGQQVSMACDAWLTPAENLRALGLTIESMRGQVRWKSSGIMQRQFTGFKALPAQGSVSYGAWWVVLSIDQRSSAAVIRDRYTTLAKYYHPDNKVTGNRDMFELVQEAYKQSKIK